MIFTWLTDEELREIGWSEEHIRTGLVAQVAAFFFVKDEDDVYSVRRNFIRGSYDFEEDVTFRGHQHIQLLEAVIAAKKALAMMDVGTVEELTRQKIAILEEIASCEA